jgi:hypothetical protein
MATKSAGAQQTKEVLGRLYTKEPIEQFELEIAYPYVLLCISVSHGPNLNNIEVIVL